MDPRGGRRSGRRHHSGAAQCIEGSLLLGTLGLRIYGSVLRDIGIYAFKGDVGVRVFGDRVEGSGN